MSKALIVLFASFLSLSAFAQSPTCEYRATEKKLAGAAKSSFMKKCEADSGSAVSQPALGCEARAAEKKLAGAAKNSFLKKCEADAGSVGTSTDATPACEAKASEKKLAGAAKSSFLKKCVKDASGG